MRLLLVRHGQIPSNVHGILDTAEPGPSLTEVGQEQARALSRTLTDEPIETLWASVLARTQETIAPTADERGLPVTVLPGLREILAGDLEGERTREAQRAYMTTVFAWATGTRGCRAARPATSSSSASTARSRRSPRPAPGTPSS